MGQAIRSRGQTSNVSLDENLTESDNLVFLRVKLGGQKGLYELQVLLGEGTWSGGNPPWTFFGLGIRTTGIASHWECEPVVELLRGAD